MMSPCVHTHAYIYTCIPSCCSPKSIRIRRTAAGFTSSALPLMSSASGVPIMGFRESPQGGASVAAPPPAVMYAPAVSRYTAPRTNQGAGDYAWYMFYVGSNTLVNPRGFSVSSVELHIEIVRNTRFYQ